MSAEPSNPSTISPIAVLFIGTLVRYAATRNQPHRNAAFFPKHILVKVNSPPAFGYFGTMYAYEKAMIIITRAPRIIAIAVPATPEFGRNFLPGLTKLPQPITQPNAIAQTFIGLSDLCSSFLSFMNHIPAGCK